MTVITTTLHVGPDGAISIPEKLPAGDYTATITPARTPPHSPRKPFTMEDFPIDDGPLGRQHLAAPRGHLRR